MVIPLSQLERQTLAIIEEVNNVDLLPKLVEFGIMPGVELSVQNRAPFNGPVSILANGTKILIRKKEADFILVKTF